MNDTPSKRPARRPLLLVAAIFAALTIGFTIGVAQAADQRLDEARPRPAEGGGPPGGVAAGRVPEKAQRRFERHRGRALHHVAQAMEQIDAAKDAVDNPDATRRRRTERWQSGPI